MKKPILTICAGPHHFVASTNENGYGLRICALLDDKHLVSCRSESEFTNESSFTELCGGQILEPGDDPPVGSDRNELRPKSQPRTGNPKRQRYLYLGTTNPADGGKLILH